MSNDAIAFAQQPAAAAASGAAAPPVAASDDGSTTFADATRLLLGALLAFSIPSVSWGGAGTTKGEELPESAAATGPSGPDDMLWWCRRGNTDDAAGGGGYGSPVNGGPAGGCGSLFNDVIGCLDGIFSIIAHARDKGMRQEAAELAEVLREVSELPAGGWCQDY